MSDLKSFDLGVICARKGHSDSMNPYIVDTHNWMQWLRGYWHAKIVLGDTGYDLEGQTAEGYKAFQEGVISENPHPHLSAKHSDWEAGFEFGKNTVPGGKWAI